MRLSLLLLSILVAADPAPVRAQAEPARPTESDARPAPKPKAKARAKKKAVKSAPASSDAASATSAASGASTGAAATAPIPPPAPPPSAPVSDTVRPDGTAPPPGGAATAGAAPAGSAAASTATSPDLHHFGLQADLGWPGGGAIELVYRPVPWFRASAGPAFNLLGFGLRAGVGFMPWQSWSVTPTFNLDYGHFFSGDLNKFVDASSQAERAVLSDAAYDWIAGTVGVEFGSQQGFAFYLRGGLTFLWANVPAADATALAQEAIGPGTPVTSSDVKVRGLLPSFSLGIIWYLF